MTKDTIVLIINGALAVGLLVLVGLGKVEWPQFVVGLGLLAVPSALQKGSSS